MTSPDLTRTESYDYFLPKELIAQNPAEPRDMSRLLAVGRKDGLLCHLHFRDIGECLHPGDLLVLNDTKVLPARIEARKVTGARVEVFCLRPSRGDKLNWEALVKLGRKLPEGTKVLLGNETELTVGDRLPDGLRLVRFPEGSIPTDIIHRYGKTPLPHYITSTDASPERYQTVYADNDKENSVAAPTAGLHFTKGLLEKLKNGGIDTAYITLQVGLGTFRPVKSEVIFNHTMHSELCEISGETAAKIRSAKKNGNRVVAVGTTVVRTLESFALEYGEVRKGQLDTRLFIRPGFEFSVTDALITNFHLPKSTLLMLVSAFGGYENIMNAYKEAVRLGYRFFSFGDSMFIG